MQVPGTGHMEWGEQTVGSEMRMVRKALCDVYVQVIHHSVRGAHIQAIHSS